MGKACKSENTELKSPLFDSGNMPAKISPRLEAGTGNTCQIADEPALTDPSSSTD